MHEPRRRIEPRLLDEPKAAQGRRERMHPDDNRSGDREAERPRVRRGFWIDIAVVLTIAFIVFNGVPMAIEQSRGPCRAVEAKVSTAFMPDDSSPVGLAMMQALVNVSGGSVALEVAKRDHPDLPPSLACSAFYWQTLLDPGPIGRMRDASTAPAIPSAPGSLGSSLTPDRGGGSSR